MPAASPYSRILLVVLAFMLGCWATVASAQEDKLKDAIGLFSEKSFSKTIAGVERVAESGAEHAPDILNAMIRRRVYLNAESKTAVYRKGRSYFDFISGKRIDARPEGASSVRVNNRVRNAIKAALGTLQLRATDPAKRLAAAAEVFQSKDTSVREAIAKLIPTERDPAVKKAFTETHAALVIADDATGKDERLAAIAVLSQRGTRDAAVALQPATRSTDPQVAEAARTVTVEIERWLAVAANVQNVWYGLSLGSVLLLAAIGLAITFGVMGVINMAHGEMVMLGAYTTFVVQEAFRAYAPEAFDLSLPIAIPLAFAVAGLVGVAIERGIIQFLYGRPLETLLATWGVSLILQQAVRTIFGPTNREVGAPSYMSGGFEFMGLAITYNRLWIIVFTLVVFASLLLVLRMTTLGLQMRAVTQNRRMAASMGIRTGYVDAMTFGLGSGIAGIAGVALSQIDNVSPNLGQSYIVDSFMVVVFGGVGSLWGTLVSAMALGVTNKFLEPWAGAVLAKIVILVLLILFIQKRPRGLFALKGRAVEA